MLKFRKFKYKLIEWNIIFKIVELKVNGDAKLNNDH
jgi:hypothetical protein